MQKMQAEKRAAQERLRERADLFAERACGATLWRKQREVLQSVSRHSKTAVKSCHTVGKTYTAAHTALWFLFTRKPAEVVTTATTGHQVKHLLWKEINMAWRNLPPDLRELGECMTQSIKIRDERGETVPGHLAYGFSTDDSDYFQGIHSPHLMVIVDEAAGVSEDIFSAIDTLGGGVEYRELLIGNPTSTRGTFRDAFRKPELNYNCITIAAEDTPNWTGEDIPGHIRRQLLQPAKVAEWRAKYGENSPWFQSRVHALFPEQGEDDVVVPMSWVERAQRRAVPETLEGPVQIGADIARFGGDATCLAERVGPVLTRLQSWPGDTSTPQVKGYIRTWAQRAREHYNCPVKVVIDEGGVGGGVVDDLRLETTEGIAYTGVMFSGSANDTKFALNRRAEMYWEVRKAFEEGEGDFDIIIACDSDEVDRLCAQITDIHYEFNSLGKLKIESKDDIRARSGHSPDEADAVVMAYAPGAEGVLTGFSPDPRYSGDDEPAADAITGLSAFME